MGGEVVPPEQKKMAAALDEKQLLDKLWETYVALPRGGQAPAV